MTKNTIEKTLDFITMDDGFEIAVHTWKAKSLIKKQPKYIVCISHGMAEHAERYNEFASFLCDNECIVFVHDHRGHGKTVEKNGTLGYISKSNGFQRVVLDLRNVIEYAKKDFPGVKTILIGHSFGSFVSQSFIQQFGDEVDACILSGTAGPNPVLTTLGELVARCIIKVKGSDKPSPFLDKLTFGSYNNKINNPTSEKAWISRNEESVKNYIEDPNCGFICTAGFFADLTHGLNTIHKEKNIRKVRKDLPILLFAGTGDPVGGYTKTIKTLATMYRKHDVQKVDEKYYLDGRHEMLSENNKDEVYNDVLKWLESC